MQSCSKELLYLSGQQERILHRDWSDLMVDPPSVRMEYEVRGERSAWGWCGHKATLGLQVIVFEGKLGGEIFEGKGNKAFFVSLPSSL